MAFTFKTFKQIIDEMVSTVRSNYKRKVDINVGSLVRTVLEAAALQDAAQYIQLARMNEAFSYLTATGEDLRRRALDYDVEEVPPQKSLGVNALRVSDSNITADAVVSSTLAADLAVRPLYADISATDWASFPATGKVIINRDVAGKRETASYGQKTSPARLWFANPNNFLKWSNTFDAAKWSVGAVSLSTGSVGADGTQRTRITLQAGNGWHEINSIPQGTAIYPTGWAFWTASISIKPISGVRWVSISADGNLFCWFDLQTGILTSQDTGTTGRIRVDGDGYRIQVQQYLSGGSGRYLRLNFCNGDKPAGDYWSAAGTETAEIWNAQLTGYDGEIPYVATNGAAVIPASFSLPALTHFAGASMILSTSGADHPIPAGTVVRAPATDARDALDFETTDDATLFDGDLYADVSGRSLGAGVVQNIAVGEIDEFASRPWPTATVTNLLGFQGGTDQQTDDDIRAAIKDKIRSYYGTTASALETAAMGVTLPDTGQSVISAQAVEPTALYFPTYLYLDDGNGSVTEASGFYTQVATSTGDVAYGLQVLKLRALAGERRFRLGVFPLVAGTLRLYRSIPGTVGTITAWNPSTRQCTISGWTGITTNQLTDYLLVDDSGRMYRINSNTSSSATLNILAAGAVAPTLGGCSVIKLPLNNGAVFGALSGSPAALVPSGNYTFNETTGEGELGASSALLAGETLVVCAQDNSTPAYSYYTGLIAEVQKVINGDRNDLTNYPGVRSAGTKVVVQFSTVDYYNFVIQLTSALGVDETTLYDAAKQAVVTYMNTLKVGDPIIISKVSAAISAVAGVADVIVLTPSGNQSTPAGHLARTTLDRVSLS